MRPGIASVRTVNQIIRHRLLCRPLLPLLLGISALPSPAQAEVAKAPAVEVKAENKTVNKPESQPETTPALTIKNERLRALDGSSSPWSGQFNLSYSGPSINKPFSAEAPNPGKVVPAPAVSMSGTFSLRNRLDPTTTAGVGTGVGTETPFQGPRNTRMSDPYMDLARRISIGPVMVRAGISAKQYTSYRYRVLNGYRSGMSFFSDTVYEIAEGATIGMIFNGFANSFYDSKQYKRSGQMETQFYLDPTFEYRFNSTLNFRTMTAITYLHTRDMSPRFKYRRTPDFQQLGLGITAAQGLYFNIYAKLFPFGGDPVTADNTTLGMNMIVNLF